MMPFCQSANHYPPAGFFVAGYLILDLTCFGKLASGAMSMEVSSVFLSVPLWLTLLGDRVARRMQSLAAARNKARHLMTRQIDGKRCALVSDLAAAVFVSTSECLKGSLLRSILPYPLFSRGADLSGDPHLLVRLRGGSCLGSLEPPAVCH